MLGALGKVDWPEMTCTLAAGETLVVFTDGVTDALGKDGERFGAERLTDQLTQAGEHSTESICEAIVDALAAFQCGEQADDIAVVALQFVGKNTSHPSIEKDARMLTTTGA
jgi:sigma-B regulation protein RsbU (phosphoserine phosphatase)